MSDWPDEPDDEIEYFDDDDDDLDLEALFDDEDDYDEDFPPDPPVPATVQQ